MARGLERLVVALRLANATTLAEANTALEAYLPRFNARFAVAPAHPELAYRPWTDERPLAEVFCFKYVRTVAADNTISFAGQRLQLLPGRERRSYAHAQVQVQERLDGSLVVCHAGHILVTTPAPLDAPTLRARAGRRATATPAPSAGNLPPGEPARPSTSAGPAQNHPWRRPLLPKQAAVPSPHKQR